MRARLGAVAIAAAIAVLGVAGCSSAKSPADDQAPPPSKNAGTPETNAPVAIQTPPPAAGSAGK